ncbi:MAG TPA: 5-oxoprolinase subunit PxpA, partial [Puia sp.]|nr:5-oxoprolinase subunit PxpA [Puia sp.]
AGDADTMRRTVGLALEHGVAIGAHPSYPDRDNFGRVDILGVSLQPDQLVGALREQLHRLQDICCASGTRIRHVKPHGALYNRAARDPAVAMLIVQAIANFDDSLLLYGLSGSVMKQVADVAGIRFVSEVFADRTYRPDGSLTPRSEPGALIEEPAVAVAEVLKMVKEGRGETVCLHGDGSHAVEFARMIHEALTDARIRIISPSRG